MVTIRPNFLRRFQGERQEYSLAAFLFLRGLALVHATAFWSDRGQILGLIGSRGILPAATWLESARQVLGLRGFWLLPSLGWLSASDFVLQAFCVSGFVVSLLLFFGVYEGPALLLAWSLRLSIISLGQDFYAFQWDGLLLEASFLSLGIVSWSRRAALREAPGWVRVAFVFLVLRLHFFSGFVKLASGDPTWRDLSALRFHFETQPLPTPLAPWFHALPSRALQGLTAVTLLLELGLPILAIGGGAAVRRKVGLLFLALQGGIALTGNYTYFNFLAAVLCLWLLDDAFWRRHGFPFAAPRATWGGISVRVRNAFAVALLVLAGLHLSTQIGLQPAPGGVAHQSLQVSNRWGLISNYGLFARMTTVREEILLEASLDGKSWAPFELPYKPGGSGRGLFWVAPHQPRLDWQFWFAALSEPGAQRWWSPLMMRLLEGEPSVHALFRKVPLDSKPPRYLRARKERFQLENGAWKRTPAGMYQGVISLDPP